MNTTYQNYLDDPQLRQRLERQARRERSREIARVFAELLKALFTHRPTRHSRMLHRSTAW